MRAARSVSTCAAEHDNRHFRGRSSRKCLNSPSRPDIIPRSTEPSARACPIGTPGAFRGRARTTGMAGTDFDFCLSIRFFQKKNQRAVRCARLPSRPASATNCAGPNPFTNRRGRCAPLMSRTRRRPGASARPSRCPSAVALPLAGPFGPSASLRWHGARHGRRCARAAVRRRPQVQSISLHSRSVRVQCSAADKWQKGASHER